MKHLNRLIVLAVAGAAVAGGVAGCARNEPQPQPEPVPAAASEPVVTPSAEPAATEPATEPAPAAPDVEQPALEPPTIEAAAPKATTKAPAKTDLVGTQYGYLTDVDTGSRTVTFDKVEWFTGAAAGKACKADGVRITDSAMCNDYYIRNHNPKLRKAALAPGAKLSLQSPNDIMVQLETSLDGLAAESPNRLFILTFKDGQVSRVKEQFTP